MESSDLLLTIAEVAIAIAGFTALAAVFAGTGEESAGSVMAVRFRSMLTSSFTVVLGCFLPLLPAHYGVGVESAWSVAAVIFVLLTMVMNLVLLRGYIAIRAEVSPYAGPSFIVVTTLASWSPLILLGLAFAGVGTVSGNYIVALLCLLAYAFLLFARAIASVLTGRIG